MAGFIAALAGVVGYWIITGPERRLTAAARYVASNLEHRLNEGELAELREDALRMGYRPLARVSRELEDSLPMREVPLIQLGEPRGSWWDAPYSGITPLARIIAVRMIEEDSWQTILDIGHDKIGFQVACEFFPALGENHPEVALSHLNTLYARCWPSLDLLYYPQNYTSAVFRGMDRRPDHRARELLLRGEHHGNPWSKPLEDAAMEGLLTEAIATGEFQEWLEWKLGPGKHLSDFTKSHGFNVDISPSKGLTLLGLGVWASKDPPTAASWAELHQANLKPDWPAAVAAGWLEFWPETPEAIPIYHSRHEDMLRWLSKHVEPDSPTIFNLLVRPSSEHAKPFEKWLNLKDCSEWDQRARAEVLKMRNQLGP
jgi:hypothetical protein